MSHCAVDPAAGTGGGCLPDSHLQELPHVRQEGRIRDVQAPSQCDSGGYDSGILPRWRREDCFCKGNYVEMTVIGKTGIIAIATAEIKTGPHILLQ